MYCRGKGLKGGKGVKGTGDCIIPHMPIFSSSPFFLFFAICRATRVKMQPNCRGSDFYDPQRFPHRVYWLRGQHALAAAAEFHLHSPLWTFFSFQLYRLNRHKKKTRILFACLKQALKLFSVRFFKGTVKFIIY